MRLTRRTPWRRRAWWCCRARGAERRGRGTSSSKKGGRSGVGGVSCARIAGSVSGMAGPRDVGVNSSPPRHTRPDLAVARLAKEQHGVVSLSQLRRLGLTKEDATYRVRVGRWYWMLRGVYAVGHPEVGQRGWFAAALLAVGPEAVLSHRAAAAVWGFRT